MLQLDTCTCPLCHNGPVFDSKTNTVKHVITKHNVTGQVINAYTQSNARLCLGHFFLPVEPLTINVEGVAVKLADVVRNPQAGYLKHHPEAVGQWCKNKSKHDMIDCKFIHRKDITQRIIDFSSSSASSEPTILVDNQRYPVSILIRTKAVERLIEHQQLHDVEGDEEEQGHCCMVVSPHDVDTCPGVHGVVPAGTSPQLWVNAVKVDGATLLTSALMMNAAVAYLVQNPRRQGSLCVRKEAHAEAKCTFVHLLPSMEKNPGERLMKPATVRPLTGS